MGSGWVRGDGMVHGRSAPLVASEGAVDAVLAGYCGYLLRERGLAVKTVRDYERCARLFFAQFGDQRAGSVEVDSKRITEFVVRECPRRSVREAANLVVALRSLLRYLYLAGVTDVSLVGAVPAVAARRQRLPRAVEPPIVERLLASCDQGRMLGRRDHAILLTLARLGLRAGEIAAIRLEDIDWRAGELLVRGKGDRRERLPLPVDVGDAVASYLRDRGRHGTRELFLRVQAPVQGMTTPGIRAVVHSACRRVGVDLVGPHQLRHTAATGMLRAGASLPQIAEVLRHSRLETTAIYAKVDRAALREVALPWPGGAK